VVDRVVVEGWSVTAAAAAAAVSERSVYRWLARFRAEGPTGLIDRSSAPKTIPRRTSLERQAVIEQLRRLRLTAAEIAEQLQMPLSTVSAVLARIGLGKRSRLEPPTPPNRYERARAGELVHIDIKKLGRIHNGPGHRVTGDRRNQRKRTIEGKRIGAAGWDFIHVAVDDYTRLAYAEILTDEKATTAVGFLQRALAFFAAHGITVERVMTDNGPAYLSTAHAAACRDLGLKHLRTQPYRPRTNGKAERFIQTLLRRWAYRRPYRTNPERASALKPWLAHYNFTRPHGSLGHKPPGSRLTNLPRNYN
jgi:transposase InsO family protein